MTKQAKHTYDDVIARLKQRAPEQAARDDNAHERVRTTKLRTQMMDAAQQGDLDGLLRAHDGHAAIATEIEHVVAKSNATTLASDAGHLEIVRALHQRGAIIGPANMLGAGINGHLHIIHYLHENGVDLREQKIVVQPDLSKIAANGHLHVLQALKDLGLDMTKYAFSFMLHINRGPNEVALFEFFKNIVEEKYGDTYSASHPLYGHAFRHPSPYMQPGAHGYIDTANPQARLSWPGNKDPKDLFFEGCVNAAIRNDAVDLLEHLHKNYYRDIETIARRHTVGNIQPPSFRILKFMGDNGVNLKDLSARALRDTVLAADSAAVSYLLEKMDCTQDILDHVLRVVLTARELDERVFENARLLVRRGAKIDFANFRREPGKTILPLIMFLHKDCGIDLKAHAQEIFKLTLRADDSGQSFQYMVDNGCRFTPGPQDHLHAAATKCDINMVHTIMDAGFFTKESALNAAKDAINHDSHPRTPMLQVADAILGYGFSPNDITNGQPRRKFLAYKAWARKIDPLPESLLRLSPHYFREKTYNDVLEMLGKEGHPIEFDKRMHDHGAASIAYHAAGLFKTTDRVLAYLDKWGTPGKQPLHNLIFDFTLPPQGRFNISAWGDAVLRHGPKMAKLLPYAADLPEPLKDVNGQWSYRATQMAAYDIAARKSYRRGEENMDLARLFVAHAMPEDRFNTALSLVEKHTAKPPHRIPGITIDGGMFDKAGYVFYKLNDNDPRGLLLGKFTDCCQHLGGAGADCAQHGFSSPEAGFYVVADSKNDAIVAQSWVWRGKGGELVFDSFESLGNHMNTGQWEKLINIFANAAQNHTLSRISAIHVGTGGETPRMDYPMAQAAQPVDYDGYRDSKQQYKIGTPS